MNNDSFLSEIIEKYQKLESSEENIDFKISTRKIFENFNFHGNCEEIFDFLTKVKDSIQMTTNDISAKCNEQSSIIKMMQLQVCFFLSFYEFLVSKLSFVIEESLKDDISYWLVDILSKMNVYMGNNEWKIFMANVVISFHPYIASVLLEVYECLGLDTPAVIEPVGYNIEEEIKYNTSVQIVKRSHRTVNKVNLEESIEMFKNKERNSYRPELHLDKPHEILNNIKKNAPIITSEKCNKSVARSKSVSSKLASPRERKKVTSAKKPRKRKSLAHDTPNVKVDFVAKCHRAAVAAAKKLNGKVVIAAQSPMPTRTQISTPTILRKLRRASSITMKILEEKNGPANDADLWVKRQQDEERSLTNFSTNSFDLQTTTSLSTMEKSNKRVTRFSSKIFDFFMSPTKDTQTVNVKSDNNATIEKNNATLSLNKVTDTKPPSLLSPKRNHKTLFSPKKTFKSLSLFSPRKTPVKETKFSPNETKNIKFYPLFSPQKTPKKEITKCDISKQFPNKTENEQFYPLFSPKKSILKEIQSKSTPKQSFLSPVKSSGRILSPRKVRKLISSPDDTLTSENSLKSCLKSPLRRPYEDSELVTVKRRKTVTGSTFPSSVLLSPKIKQRTFLTNKPPQDYCEDTMFMDTDEFIRSSGSARSKKRDHVVIGNGSPLPGYIVDSSQSSIDTVKTERVKVVPKKRLSLQRKLFDVNSTVINTSNILQTSRRSTVTLPNFQVLEPETDSGSGFKF